MEEKLFKTAIVGMVGRTNAGKSSLVNALAGEKVAIVSAVEQTTRNTIRAIVEDDRGQLVLLDTPGLHKAQGNLGKVLNAIARKSSAGADVLCVVFDASCEIQMEDEGWMQRIANSGRGFESIVFCLNKRDQSPFFGEDYKRRWREISNCAVQWVEASATSSGGADALKDALFCMAQPGERLFPEDVVSDYPRRLAIADAVREKLMRRVYQEVPHEMGVVVRDIRESPGAWNVTGEVIVNRDGQKGIVIGKGASTIKAARKSAERELSEAFGVKVHLELHVKVVRNWMKNPAILAEMGLAVSQ